MNQGRLLRLDDFAYAFLKDKRHFNEVHAEDLAEAFRAHFAMPDFPSIVDLRKLCTSLGIAVRALPPDLDASGLNTWSEEFGHEIYLNESTTLVHYQHTLCHELREVIEQTFARTHPHYVPLDTHNNDVMNPLSDRFAACLLMPADPTRHALRSVGFDVVRFAADTVRSVSSVVLRAQELFPAGASDGIAGAVWLFERDWKQRDVPGIAMSDMHLRHRAHLGGFSMDKKGTARAKAARAIFPTKGTTVDQFAPAMKAFGRRRPYVVELGLLDLFAEERFIVGAEPLMSGVLPMRIVVTAVQTRYRPIVEPWLARLGVRGRILASPFG